MATSYFSFHFRLLPWEACLHLNFDQVLLAEGVGAVCTRDQLGLFIAGDPQHNETLRIKAHQLARSLVHAHAYCSFPRGLVLDVEPVTWLEIRDCEPKPTVTGYMHPSLASVSLEPRHPDNAALRQAADLVRNLGGNPSLDLALADFHAARREPGPYYAFYAFRTLEDVGYAFGTAKDDKPCWDAMNLALGTTKATWDPLTDAGTTARHLKPHEAAALASQRDQLLRLAHDALDRTITHLMAARPTAPSSSSPP